jgi:hypothetical protein
MLLPATEHGPFWSRVERGGQDDCWRWTASVNGKGYGRFRVGGRWVTASRISWALAHDVDFPADKIACHTCDNPPCCNPDHIWPGTTSENAQDAINKGRRPSSKLATCGHDISGENVVLHRGIKHCRTCTNADYRARNSKRSRKRLHKQVESPFGPGKLCRRCGHHRVDDYKNGSSIACRQCSLAKARNRDRSRSAAHVRKG